MPSQRVGVSCGFDQENRKSFASFYSWWGLGVFRGEGRWW